MTLRHRPHSVLAPELRECVSQQHLEPFIRQTSSGVAARLEDWSPPVLYPRTPVVILPEHLELAAFRLGAARHVRHRSPTFGAELRCRCCPYSFMPTSAAQVDCPQCAKLIPAKLRQCDGRRAWSARLASRTATLNATRERARVADAKNYRGVRP